MNPGFKQSKDSMPGGNESAISLHQRQKRGSALILCISLVVFVLLVGLTFLSATRLERISTSATSHAANTDAAVNSAIGIVGQAITQDELNYLNSPTASPGQFTTSLTTNHPWLAATAPQPDVGQAAGPFGISNFPQQMKWQQISWVGTNVPNYVDANTMTTPLAISGTNAHVVSIAVVNGGSGYSSSSPPAVSFSGGSGAGVLAMASVNSNGSISAITVTNEGSGYTAGAPPSIAIAVGSGTQATAVAFLDTDIPNPYAGLSNSTIGYAQTLPMEPITTWTSNLVASADGSGYSDSRWMQLPISSLDGLTYVAAVRIIDNSSMINVNTATEAEPGRPNTYLTSLPPYPPTLVLGETPADVNLERFLASANFNPAVDWQTTNTTGAYTYVGTLGANPSGFNVPVSVGIQTTNFAPYITTNSWGGSGAPGAINAMANLYGYQGYTTNTPFANVQTNTLKYLAPLTNADRLSMWAWNEAHFANPITNAFRPFGTTDECELRLHSAVNGNGWSPLEEILDGNEPASGSYPARIGVLRAARPETGTIPTYAQYLADVRRLLTTYNGSRALIPRWSNPAVMGLVSGSLVGNVGTLTLTNPGSGYNPASPPPITITPAPPGPGVQATATTTVSPNPPYEITGLTITSPGSGYPLTTVTLSAPPAGGTQALAYAYVPSSGANANTVQNIFITNPGSGYTVAPSVTFAGTGGAGAIAVTTLGALYGSVSTITVTNPGTGYPAAPQVSIPPPTSGITATATVTLTGVHYVNANTAGDYQLNPNLCTNPNPNYYPTTSNALNYYQTFLNCLTQGGTTYEGSTANATDAAYSLTANLLAALDPANLYDPMQDAVTSGTATYYPLKLQPFFKEASVTYVYTATTGTTIDTTVNPDAYLVIELGNPFPVPIDLRNFYLNVAESPTAVTTDFLVLPAGVCDDGSNYLIPPGGHVIVYSEIGSGDLNDADVKSTVQTLDTTHYTVQNLALGAALTPLINSITPPTTPAPLILTLVYRENPPPAIPRVVVDKMTASGTYTVATPNPTGPGNKYPFTGPTFDATITTTPAGGGPFTQPANWPPIPLTEQSGPPPNNYFTVPSTGGRLIISAALERDDTEFDPFPTDGTSPPLYSLELPHYVYDNPNYNLVETTPPVGVNPPGTPIPIQNRMNLANQSIKAVRITNPGSGYTAAPSIAFTPASTTAATVSAPVNGQITTITLTNAGAYPGYTASGYGATYPYVTFGTPTTGVTATGVVGIGQKLANYVSGLPGGSATNAFIFQVTPVVPLINTVQATFTNSAMPAPLQLTLPMGSIPPSIYGCFNPANVPPATIIGPTGGSPGFKTSPYVPPIITISAPNLSGGTQATAVATIRSDGTLGGISPTNVGSGYLLTSVTIGPPNLPGGTQATALAYIPSDGGISQYILTNAGLGYTAAPSVNVSAPNLPGGTPALATSTLSGGSVNAVLANVVGAGYAHMPTITIDQSSVSGPLVTGQLIWWTLNPQIFRTVGDMASLMTYANRAAIPVAPNTYVPISAWLTSPRAPADQATICLGRIHFDQYIRSDYTPALPVGLSLFDNFSTLISNPTGTQTVPSMIYGQININTAPREVLAMLPYFTGLGNDFVTPAVPDLASALVAYRDMVNLTPTNLNYPMYVSTSPSYARAYVTGIGINGVATPAPPYLRTLSSTTPDGNTELLSVGEPLMLRVNTASSYFPNATGYGASANFNGQVSGTSLNGINMTNDGVGYPSAGAINVTISPPPDAGTQATGGIISSKLSGGAMSTVTPGGSPWGTGYDANNPPSITIASDSDNYDITRQALNYTDAGPAQGDVTGPDGVYGDFKQQMLHYQRIASLITTRSDVFTAYVVLQGRKYNSVTGTWQVAVQRRFVVGFDRSNIDGSVPNAMPKILYYAEEH